MAEYKPRTRIPCPDRIWICDTQAAECEGHTEIEIIVARERGRLHHHGYVSLHSMDVHIGWSTPLEEGDLPTAADERAD